MNTENSKTNESNKVSYILLTISILKILIKILRWLNQAFLTHGNTLNLHITTINLKYLPQLGMMNLIYLMDHILYVIHRIILNTLLKTQETVADNSPIQIYINKIKNYVVFKIKTGYKLELLSIEAIKLLRSTVKVIA